MLQVYPFKYTDRHVLRSVARQCLRMSNANWSSPLFALSSADNHAHIKTRRTHTDTQTQATYLVNDSCLTVPIEYDEMCP